MAVVTQTVTPSRSYTPFEGPSEAQRNWSSIPRGMTRFNNLGPTVALQAKPVNDSIDLQFTCSLPAGFAYVFSYLSFELQVDTASDWDVFCTCTIFNGIPGGPAGSFPRAVCAMPLVPDIVANDPRRILDYSLGDVSEWFHTPTIGQGAGASTFLLNYHNSAAAVQAAGVIRFHAGFYQYELNQAVRFPLNYPLPVGQR